MKVYKLIIIFEFIRGYNMFLLHQVETTVNSIKLCDGKQLSLRLELAMRKFSRTKTAFYGNGSVPFDLGDDIKANMVIAKYGDSGSRSNIFNMDYPYVCDGLNKFFGEVWWSLEAQLKPPLQKGVCPIPRGNYTLKGHVIDFSKMGFQIPIPGHYLFTLKLFNKKRAMVLCFQADITLKRKG